MTGFGRGKSPARESFERLIETGATGILLLVILMLILALISYFEDDDEHEDELD